jgi:hypothetical protein
VQQQGTRHTLSRQLPAVGYRQPCACCVCLLACVVQASAEIMRLLAQSAPGCSFEKASIDEAYLDITGLAVSVRTCTPTSVGCAAATQRCTSVQCVDSTEGQGTQLSWLLRHGLFVCCRRRSCRRLRQGTVGWPS